MMKTDINNMKDKHWPHKDCPCDECGKRYRETKTIGRRISDLEQQLRAYSEADNILNQWKFRFSLADKELKKQMIIEMLNVCGYSQEDIDKMCK